jgi:hypothetical protein
MGRPYFRRSGIVSAARVLLASGLLAAFLSGIVPIASVSAGSRCQLECCAGKPAHASGSCMNRSCQADLTAHAHNQRANRVQAEKLCGFPKKIDSKSSVRKPAVASTLSSADQVTRAFERPCPPDCGGCASGFTNSNRQRNSATTSITDRLSSPTDIRLSDLRYHRVRILRAQCRPGTPRGPPLSLS